MTAWKRQALERIFMRIFFDNSKLISKDDIWVCICEGYLYIGDTIAELIEILNKEWKHDKHICG